MTLDNISVDEKALTQELRVRLGHMMTIEMYEDDTVFRRFLKARNYDISAAETMLRNHINWRKKNKVDQILVDYTPPKVGEKYFPRTVIGYDNDGAPVFYADFGDMDYKGMLKTYTKREIILYVIRHFESDVEKMKKQSAKLGKTIDKSVYIFNLDNFPLSSATYKPAIDIIAYLMRMYEANYPERLKTAYIINVSIYFSIAWAILKNFLTGTTHQKIKIFGKDGWKEDLVKYMDPNILPGFLGGNLTDPDGNPMCWTFVNHAQKVPEECYFDKSIKNQSEIKNAKKLFIARMSKEEIKLEVMYAGSLIEWTFENKNKDIGFSLLYKESGNQNCQEILPKQRIETEITPETGVFRCEKPGIYILEFDNTYSWIHHKELYYTVSIILPNQQNLLTPE